VGIFQLLDHCAFSRLFRFASLRMRDAEAVRDIVQQALCRALRNLSGYRNQNFTAHFNYL
jgi:DNA-directed RNA polymerase specialized sigma24 family protein